MYSAETEAAYRLTLELLDRCDPDQNVRVLRGE